MACKSDRLFAIGKTQGRYIAIKKRDTSYNGFVGCGFGSDSRTHPIPKKPLKIPNLPKFNGWFRECRSLWWVWVQKYYICL